MEFHSFRSLINPLLVKYFNTAKYISHWLIPFIIIFLFIINCRPVPYCNAGDLSNKCGIVQSILQGTGTSTGTGTGTSVTYTISGTISGYSSSGLVLQNNAGDNLTVTSGATTFTFATPIANSGSYNVTVFVQPGGQTCLASSNTGTIAGANITNVSVSCISQPSQPSGVNALPGNTQNTISWSLVTGATSYNIYWGTATGVTIASGTKIPSVTSPHFHTGLTNGTTYYYILTAVNAAGESVASAEVNGVPACNPCKMYLTATTYGGNLGGIPGADTKCNMADANKPATGTYKALLVDGIARRACTSANCVSGGVFEHIDWVLHPTTTYVRSSDGGTIFITNASGVNPINLIGVITTATTTAYWTGIANTISWDWITNTATCSSWTDGVTASCGSYGLSSWTDSRSIAITSALGNGNGTTVTKLLCVEQ